MEESVFLIMLSRKYFWIKKQHKYFQTEKNTTKAYETKWKGKKTTTGDDWCKGIGKRRKGRKEGRKEGREERKNEDMIEEKSKQR